MIKINKTINVPAVLQNAGVNETINNKALYDDNPVAYQTKYDKNTNPYKLKFKSSIYGHTTVKQQLKYEQFNKCCFCENKDFDDVAYGDVEHFRPKGGYRQKTDDELAYPGYYWLAYDWSNLFFSCQICNQKYKKNMFPLVDATQRAIDHNYNLESTNNTLLVHPSLENPENEIGFRKEIPFGKNEKGKKSIQVFGLRREKLNDKRRKYLTEVKKNIVLSKLKIDAYTNEEIQELLDELHAPDVNHLIELINDAKILKDSAAFKESAFTSMIRNNFPNLPTN